MLLRKRDSKDFLIVARSDARSSLGLDEALRRGEALAKAGADILFIESPESIDELLSIGETFDLPLLEIQKCSDGMSATTGEVYNICSVCGAVDERDSSIHPSLI